MRTILSAGSLTLATLALAARMLSGGPALASSPVGFTPTFTPTLTETPTATPPPSATPTTQAPASTPAPPADTPVPPPPPVTVPSEIPAFGIGPGPGEILVMLTAALGAGMSLVGVWLALQRLWRRP